MGRKHFVMETRGYCLLCLKLPPNGDELSKVGVTGGNGEESCPKIFSLQRICHYLRLNMKKIFHDVIAVTPSSLPVLEKSELKGVLCKECSQLTEALSQVTLELEVLQMTLESCVRRMFEKMDSIAKNSEVIEVFKKEMLNNPQTLLHYGIVEQLRTEALEKCHALLGRMKPRVVLKKIKVEKKVAKISTPTRRNPPRCKSRKITSSSSSANIQAEAVDVPELSESIPVITLVQGSFRNVGSCSSTLSINSMEPGNVCPSPSPPTPILNESTEEEQSSPNAGTQRTVASNASASKGPDFTLILKTFSKDCNICHKRFRKNIERQDHIRVVHQGIKFKCQYCPETFRFRSGKYRHQRTNHKEVQNQADKQKIQQTLQISHETQPSKINSELEASLDPLLQPQPAQTRTRRRPPPSFKKITRECKPCRKSFGSNKLLLEHERAVHHGIKFKCTLCPSTFTTSRSLTRHRRQVHKITVKRQVRAPNYFKHQVDFRIGNIERVELPRSNPSRQMEVGKTERGPQDPLETLNAITTVTSTPAPRTSSKKFECKICKKRFWRNMTRLDHELAVHQGMKFSCGICPSKFTQRESLYKHRRKFHHLQTGSKQAKIPKNAEPQSSLQSQVEKGLNEGDGEAEEPLLPPDSGHSSLPKLEPAPPNPSIQKLRRGRECRICHKRYPSTRLLQDHERTVHQGIKFQCSYCPASFMFRSSMPRHMTQFHKNLTGQKKLPNEGVKADSVIQKREEDLISYLVGPVKPDLGGRCPQPRPLPALLSLEQKRTVEHQVKRFSCGLCSASFTRKFSLKKHENRFHDNAGQQLPGSSAKGVTTTATTTLATKVKTLFGSNFLQPGTVSTSSQSTSRKCTTCHKLFQTKRARLRHERLIHKGLRFKCRLCSAAFTLQCNLNRHKLLYCPKRAQVSTSSLQLIQPSETVRLQIGNSERIEINDGTDPLSDFLPEDESGSQPQPNPELVPERPEPTRTLNCQYCNKKFTSTRNLRRHQTTAHGTNEKLTRHSCTDCGKKYVWSYDLTRHRKIAHDQGPA